VARRTSGILFIGNNGTFHGNSVTISADVTIPENHTLTIPERATLTIAEGITLTNDGTVRNCGTINSGGNYGTWVGNAPLSCHDDGTSIIDLETQNTINVFPNPFTDILYIADAEGFTLQVLTQTGAVVHTQRIANPIETVNLQHLPAGIYILRLEKDGVVKTARVVKQ